jgi:hypothetical protein
MRSSTAALVVLTQACAATAPDERSTALASPWLTPEPAPSGSSAVVVPSPAVIATPTRSPRVDFDPDAIVVSGPAGAMRRFPGPGAEPAAKTPPAPFEEIASSLRERAQAIRRCYARALQTDPAISGKLSFRIAFDAEGHVTAVEVTSGEPRSGELVGCVQSVLRGIVIQPSEGPREITVPLVFSPG